MWPPPLELSEEGRRINTEYRCDFKKLHDVEAAFSALVLGNKGLWATDTSGYVGLGEIASLASLDEEDAEAFVSLAEDRPGQRFPRSKAGNPKTRYGINPKWVPSLAENLRVTFSRIQIAMRSTSSRVISSDVRS